MRENRLRWFGHELSREETVTVRAIMKMYVEGKDVEEQEQMMTQL